jgi:hypothetical protein
MARDCGVMMLKDGKFVRELPPVIGGNYYKTEKREYTEEELEWQEALLAAEEIEEPLELSEIIFGVMIILPITILIFLLIIGVFTDA